VRKDVRAVYMLKYSQANRGLFRSREDCALAGLGRSTMAQQKFFSGAAAMRVWRAFTT